MLAVTVATAMAVAGCGGSDGPKVALLLPGIQTVEYEAADRHSFEKKLGEICGGCELLYSNAAGDDSKQASQAKMALKQGAKVLVLDPVDLLTAASTVEEAQKKGVPVLNYAERLFKAKPDAFVAFDFAKTGELQAEVLAKKLAEEGHPGGPVIMVKGEQGNNDQYLYEEGARRGLLGANVKIAREYYTPFWYERYAKHDVERAIRVLGRNGFMGVYAETDSIAGGAIAAMKSAGIDPAMRPTTGRNASLQGLQRILGGEQYMTVYEPVERLASTGAEVAVKLAQGEALPRKQTADTASNDAVPSVLVEPVVVTKPNLAQTAIADGLVSPSELCAGRYASACREDGISG